MKFNELELEKAWVFQDEHAARFYAKWWKRRKHVVCTFHRVVRAGNLNIPVIAVVIRKSAEQQ